MPVGNATVVTEMQALCILAGMKATHLASDRAIFEDGPVCIFHTALRKSETIFPPTHCLIRK